MVARYEQHPFERAAKEAELDRRLLVMQAPGVGKYGDPRKEAEAKFHEACAARIAAREALDAAELAYGKAGRELNEATARERDRKIEQGIEARKQLNLLLEWARDVGNAEDQDRIQQAVYAVEAVK